MMRLVTLLQSAKNGNGVFDRGLADEYLLEPAFEGGILLDVLTVFIEGGRADETQFTSRKHRFQHVRGGDGTFTASSTHKAVQFVDKGDDLAV